MSSNPRTAILDAAAGVFARFGFKKASVEDIARRAGVGKGSIYLHFASKEALFEACALLAHSQGLSELEATVRRAKTPEARLRAFIDCKLEQHSRPPMGQRIEVATLFELGTQAAYLIPQMQAADAAVLVRILDEGVAQGVFFIDDTPKVARSFAELVLAVAPRMILEEPFVRVKQSLDTCFEFFIRGLSAPPPTPKRRR